jgi:hypothetical protein
MDRAERLWCLHLLTRMLFALAVMTVLTTAILLRPAKWLSHFDQSFYLTVAYDLTHHGVFSNGIFDDVNSVIAVPPPGMFFAPLYPWLIVAVTAIDPRFSAAVDCSVEENHKIREGSQCEAYANPMLVLHAAFLTAGVIAIALAAEIIFAQTALFWLAGILATLALVPDVDLFSFVMTESVTFSLYSVAALALVLAFKAPRSPSLALAGCLFGLLCLTRTSFAVLAPVVLALIAFNGAFVLRIPSRMILRQAAVFALAWLLLVGPWILRNAYSIGKWGLSEEYGSATVVERFAFDTMTKREFLLAFPYCLPAVGEPVVKWAFGPTSMDRFLYSTPGSFFELGRAQRERLIAAHGRLDPLLGEIVRAEMRERWWRYLLVTLPLGWCGMWVGGTFGLLLVPLFAAACVSAVRRREPLFLLYAAPALAMLALHAALANHYTRYNLILIGPFAVGAAFIIARSACRLNARDRLAAPALWRALSRARAR